MHGRETFDDLKLHGVGVLEFVHMDVAEPARKIFERLGVLAQQGERLGQQIVEIERVVRPQMIGVLFIHPDGRFQVAFKARAAGIFRGREPQHLGV